MRMFLILLTPMIAVFAGSAASAEGREPVLGQVNAPHSYYWREMYIPQLTGGPSSLAWTPDGRSLVYSRRGRLWRQRIGDGVAVQITNGAGYDYQPDVSPDGRRVVFTRNLNDAYELVILDTRTGRESAVTKNRAVNLDARWAPDGKRIAYVTSHGSGNFYIAIAAQDTNGWTSKRWAPERTSETPRYYYSQVDQELSPAWSPDGEHFVFIANTEAGYGSGSVYRQRVDRSTPAALLVDEETAWKARPDWSPDGTRIAYSSFAGRQWHQLWMTTANPDGYPLAFSYGDFDLTGVRWSPDGKKIAYVSNESGDGEIIIQDVVGGARAVVTADERRYANPMGALALHIVDKTGEPVPARVSIKGADGRYYASDAAMIHADDAYDRALFPSEPRYFHIDGGDVVNLPEGAAEITVWRGMRYETRHVAVNIARGETSVETIEMQRIRFADAFNGWRSGDVHVHMNYGGAYRMTPDRLAKQADAEDLDLAFNLIVNKEQRIPDIDYFSTAPFRSDEAAATILVGQEFHTSLWGHLGLLGLKSHYLLGDYAAYPKTAQQSFYPDNSTIADLAHAQSALVGYVHPYDPPAPDPSSDQRLSHALPVDAVLGKVDYLEVVGFSDPRTTESVWHRLLNTGLRIAAAGGTDAMTNYASLRGPLGTNRTFVKAEDSADAAEEVENWLAGLKSGRSIATNGPLVHLTVGDATPGDELRWPRGSKKMSFTVVMTSITPIDKLEIIINGKVAQTIPLSGDKKSARYEGAVTLGKSGWITLRAMSDKASPVIFDAYPYATTSPIYVIVGDKPMRSREDADYFIAWIEKLRAHAADGAYNTPDERSAVLTNFARARREFEKRR